MFAHVLTLAVALIVPIGQSQSNSSAQAPADSSQISLAERAALARKAAADKPNQQQSPRPDGLPALTPEQRGEVRNNAYVNDVLHFRIELGRWELQSAERISLAQAMARTYVNPDVHGSPYRVLWLADGRRTVLLSIIPLPSDAPRSLDLAVAAIKKGAERELVRVQELKESEELILLGGPGHKFAAFRISATIKDTPLVQSQQLTLADSFVVLLVITGHSDEEVSEAIRSLQNGITWTNAVR